MKARLDWQSDIVDVTERVHKMKSKDSMVKVVLNTLGLIVDDDAAHDAAGTSLVVDPAIEIRS